MSAKKHIAIVLIWLMGITIFPFNAWHQHAEDEHFAAKYQPQESNHHCHLEELFCEAGVQQNCAHKAHINKPIPACFSCQFHFVKQYLLTNFQWLSSHELITSIFNPYFQRALNTSEILEVNKGPPNWLL